MLNFFIRKINVRENGATKEKYVLRLQKVKKMTLTQACDIVAERSSLSAGDLRSSVIELAQLLADRLKIGQGLDLEELGKFDLSVSAQAQDSQDKVSLKDIRHIFVHYKPSTYLRNIIQELPMRIIRMKRGSRTDEE